MCISMRETECALCDSMCEEMPGFVSVAGKEEYGGTGQVCP